MQYGGSLSIRPARQSFKKSYQNVDEPSVARVKVNVLVRAVQAMRGAASRAGQLV
jgi:hypothetical protein